MTGVVHKSVESVIWSIYKGYDGTKEESWDRGIFDRRKHGETTSKKKRGEAQIQKRRFD